MLKPQQLETPATPNPHNWKPHYRLNPVGQINPKLPSNNAHQTTLGKKQERYQTKKANIAKQTENSRKFVKIPPATTEWQKVVRKERKKKNTRKCFFCHKTGHIQKNFRQRIKCYRCGAKGHKLQHCLFNEHPPTRKWILKTQTKKLAQSPGSLKIDNPPSNKSSHCNIPTSQPLMILQINLAPNQPFLRISLHEQQQAFVTENLASISRTQWAYSLTHPSLLPISCPIDINPFLPLLTPSARDRTFGGLRDIIALISPHLTHLLTMTLSRKKGQAKIDSLSARATLAPLGYKRQQTSLQVSKQNTFLSSLSQHKSPPQPKSPIVREEGQFIFSNTEVSQMQLLTPWPHPSFKSLSSSQTHLAASNSLSAICSIGLSDDSFDNTFNYNPVSDPLLISDPSLDLQQEKHDPNPNEVATELISLPRSQAQLDLQLPVEQTQIPLSTTVPLRQNAHPKDTKKREATCKSLRLQEKQRQNSTVLKPTARAKTRTNKVPFELPSHDSPLQVSEALSILQASGLQITQQIDDMV